MMNRVNLVGRLTKDPELRYTPNGVAVATFTLAVTRTFANSENVREADFIPIVVWRKPAENAANYLKKGDLAGVDGRIQTRNYENNEGRKVYVTEVVADFVDFLSTKGNSNNEKNQNNGSPQQSGANQQRRSQQPNPYQQQGRNQQNPYQQQNQQNNPYEDPFSGGIGISDDDLPF